jgi:cysteine desulfurase
MKTPVYMDYHATTPLDPRVLQAMAPYFTEEVGNAASKSHVFGWRAEAAVEQARGQVARLIGASPEEIYFTSGATESNNLALLGVAEGYADQGDHLITVTTEHRSVLDPCRYLERKGYRVTYLPVDAEGRVDPEAVRRAITARTILISVMAANNEIGTLQPLAEIGKVAKEKGVLLHSDAAQAVGKIPCHVDELGADLVSLSGHKIYGPKGVGALYVRRRTPRLMVHPILYGGHERGLRSGTLNVPGVVGLGAALSLAEAEMAGESARLAALRDRLQAKIQGSLEGVDLNGPVAGRLANNLNLSFAYVKSDALMMEMREVAVSSGSACTSASPEPSHVLKALGLSDSRIRSSIRFGLGRFTTEAEVDYVAGRVVALVKKLREGSSEYKMAQEGVDLHAEKWNAGL